MGGASMAKRMLSYIEEHLDQELTWEKLAETLHYSKFYMARVFKENTGTTLCKYVRDRRLETAARKLVKTNRPVIEIALEAGYGSQQAFSRAFRYKYECAPQEYRRIKRVVPKQKKVSMGLRMAVFSFGHRGGRAA